MHEQGSRLTMPSLRTPDSLGKSFESSRRYSLQHWHGDSWTNDLHNCYTPIIVKFNGTTTEKNDRVDTQSVSI